MAKNSGKMALYEVIGASKGSLIDGNKPVDLKQSEISKERTNSRSNKRNNNNYPKIIILASLAILLIFVLIFVTFKLGQQVEPKKTQTATLKPVATNKYSDTVPEKTPLFTIKKVEKTKKKPVFSSSDAPAVNKITTPKENFAGADNVICVTRYMVKRDLEPVLTYFDEQGIKLEIIKKSNNYLLVSKKRYTGGFTRIGTEASNDLKKIKRIGANYKATEEFEPFGSKPFQDAYGMKLKK